MTDRDELASWLRLTLIPGIGGEARRALLKACGGPQAIFEATPQALAAIIDPALADRLLHHECEAGIEAALDWAGQAGNQLLTLADARLPAKPADLRRSAAAALCQGQYRDAQSPDAGRGRQPQRHRPGRPRCRSLRASARQCRADHRQRPGAGHRCGRPSRRADDRRRHRGGDRHRRRPPLSGEATKPWRAKLPKRGASSASSRSARRHWRRTSRAATASLPASGWAAWWSKRPCAAAR